jgi:hypothetical protein
MIKLRLVCAAAALAATTSGTALADASANVGIMSNYIYRGIYQSDATAFAGIDIQADNGFYLGTWGANLQDGLEYDVYLGYRGGGDVVTWNVGYTGYYYTDNFDSTYREFNAGFSYGFLTIDYALGDYFIADYTDANYPSGTDFLGQAQTYQYVGATFSPMHGPYYFLGHTQYNNVNGIYPKVGNWYGTGKKGYWVEIGKAFQVMDELEIAISALYSGDVPQAGSTTPASVQLGPSSAADSEFAMVFKLTKTIGLNK